MGKVLLYSILLALGMAGSQMLGSLGDSEHLVREAVRFGTMLLLGQIMLHVGLEFEIDRSRLRSYGVDFGVAASAAGLPWILSSLYFLLMLMPEGSVRSFDGWSQALLAGCFAAPTSAGVLFSMLAAAGLSASWTFRKARVLAIFDDLDTVLLMVPLKMMLVGIRWQVGAVVAVMGGFLWAGWRWMRRVPLPGSWPWLLLYSAVIAGFSELVHHASAQIDETMPVHIEVLLPAFAFGCMLRHGAHGHAPDAGEERATTVISAAFMTFVGLSMPEIDLEASGMSLPVVAAHVLAITVLGNLGKMVPALCYADEATLRERLALAIGMWPRGEVGAGVLILAMGYGISTTLVSVATFSLALNLVLTGVFILVVKRLLAVPEPGSSRG